MSDAASQKPMAGALGRVPSGLFVVTARRGPLETGLLASWIQQCSFEPPMVSVAIKRGREFLNWLENGAAFVVNILDSSQTDMIIHFGKGFSPGEPVFQQLEVERTREGTPVLSEALAYLECRVAGRAASGDHELILGQVVDGRVLNEGQPMVHIRKSGSHY